METSLKATEKATIDAEEGTGVHEVPARSLSEPLGCLCMGKQMRWLVGLIETEKSTETVFDLLWPLLNKGERRLSVRRAVDRCALHVLVYKADQAKVDFAILPEEIRPAAVYELLKPGRGQAGTRAIHSAILSRLVRRLPADHFQFQRGGGCASAAASRCQGALG